MKRLINWILGYAVIRAEGAFPERLLNLCAQHRLPFWGVFWEGETGFVFRVRLCHLQRLEEYGQRGFCTLEELERRGGGAAFLRWRKRWGFLAGMALALAAVAVLSRFVLTVEVTGNERIPSAVILSELQRLGVRPGVYGPGLDRVELANRAIMALPELSFLSINRTGTRIRIVVREEEPPPKLLDENTPADVVAGADGIILDIHTAAGEARFADGDTVRKGEILISGSVELPKAEGNAVDMGTLVVHAAGEVRARTWRVMSASIPLVAGEKTFTGEKITLYGGKILWWAPDFFGNSGISYEKYDKITETRFLRLFGRELPIGCSAVTFREYTLTQRPIDAGAAGAMLEEELLGRLAKVLAENEGTPLRTDFVHREERGLLTVTMLAECEEEIGVTVERDGETGRIYGACAP